MELSKRQLQWVMDNIIDKMIYNKTLKENTASYIVKVYSNKETGILPITFSLPEQPLESIVVDYLNEVVRDDCYGINDYEDYIRLNCDLAKGKNIDYIINEELTTIIINNLRP